MFAPDNNTTHRVRIPNTDLQCLAWKHDFSDFVEEISFKFHTSEQFYSFNMEALEEIEEDANECPAGLDQTDRRAAKVKAFLKTEEICDMGKV
ncbi:hypothetical protein O6P43_002365 [Quillaja saponaria]|uniref:Uncharacterized protein n=1 Tax=Quillaja saponaria TaxID=32244 RepID=A0AAD7VK58_QUISA|nr:hypothetical protein O6P43_002365 [Quillaja saponaria]